jgi:hypothetical protein
MLPNGAVMRRRCKSSFSSAIFIFSITRQSSSSRSHYHSWLHLAKQFHLVLKFSLAVRRSVHIRRVGTWEGVRKRAECVRVQLDRRL